MVTAQIELPDELFSYATIVSQSMTSVDGILSWCHFFAIYTSYESSVENALRVFILTFEISLHAHLQNVLKYDYLIMKTKEAISLTWFWKPFFDINARALLRGLFELEVAGEGTWDAERRMKTIEIACIFPNPFEQRYQAKITAIKWKFDFYSIIVKAIKLHHNLVPADHSWITCYNIIIIINFIYKG